MSTLNYLSWCWNEDEWLILHQMSLSGSPPALNLLKRRFWFSTSRYKSFHLPSKMAENSTNPDTFKGPDVLTLTFTEVASLTVRGVSYNKVLVNLVPIFDLYLGYILEDLFSVDFCKAMEKIMEQVTGNSTRPSFLNLRHAVDERATSLLTSVPMWRCNCFQGLWHNEKESWMHTLINEVSWFLFCFQVPAGIHLVRQVSEFLTFLLLIFKVGFIHYLKNPYTWEGRFYASGVALVLLPQKLHS